jgi:50S ribosomal protein L16 3-hydroxylase
MDVHCATPLLGGLTPDRFMRRHWQTKPLLVRGAVTEGLPLLERSALFAMARRDDVQSRLIVASGKRWSLEHGPFSARGLPPVRQPGWTLLVQGLDRHLAAAHELLARFRFVPDARLDDLMVSWASPGGGVGPHFDSYDVFLLQGSGRRRWRIGRQKNLELQGGLPLKILKNFEAQQEFVLDAGDMLYLPPGYAHEGIADEMLDAKGRHIDCTTYSIGFRAPAGNELAGEILQRMAEACQPDGESGGAAKRGAGSKIYRDPGQAATAAPAALPDALLGFASQAIQRALASPYAMESALGGYLTEPGTSTWFERSSMEWKAQHIASLSELRLDPATRMMYGKHHVFINGESLRAGGADARLLHRLANQRRLDAADLSKASPAVREVLAEWLDSGWASGQRG